MSSMIRTIIRNSIGLSEKFAQKITKDRQLRDTHKSGQNKRRVDDLPTIYSQQGTLFNTSPTGEPKEYQKNQAPKKINSWLPAITKKAGKFYRKYTDGRTHEITQTGAQVCVPSDFRL